jgi:hypothetical protein
MASPGVSETILSTGWEIRVDSTAVLSDSTCLLVGGGSTERG